MVAGAIRFADRSKSPHDVMDSVVVVIAVTQKRDRSGFPFLWLAVSTSQQLVVFFLVELPLNREPWRRGENIPPFFWRCFETSRQCLGSQYPITLPTACSHARPPKIPQRCSRDPIRVCVFLVVLHLVLLVLPIMVLICILLVMHIDIQHSHSQPWACFSMYARDLPFPLLTTLPPVGTPQVGQILARGPRSK